MQTLLAPIVQICDAISGARPGARREIVEAYIKRLNDLEAIAMSYPAGWLLCSCVTAFYFHKVSLDRTRLVDDKE